MIDRTAARKRLRAMFENEASGPPNGTEVALRCTDHGRFIRWVSPPAPTAHIGCPPACGAPPPEGPSLRVV